MIPGAVISYLTFIGVIVHEWAHKTACRLFGVKVLEVKYFDWSTGGGYVRHEKTNSLTASFAISLAPVVTNLVLAFIVGWVYALLKYWGVESVLVFFVLLYLGVSIGMHAFPSHEDVANISALAKEMKKKKLLVLSRLLEFFFGALRLLSIFWLDLILSAWIFMAPMLIMERADSDFATKQTMEKNVTDVMENFETLSRMVRGSHPDGEYGEELLDGQFTFTPNGSATRQVLLSPYGTEYRADYDEKDKHAFWLYLTDVPDADCLYMLDQDWTGSSAIYSPEDCEMGNNTVAVQYK